MNAEIIGYIAGALTLINMLPQVMKTYKTKSAEDVSLVMVTIFALSMLFWTTYGILLGLLPVTISSAFGFLISAVEIGLIVKYKKKR